MARRRLLKSDFYLSVNGQSATTTGLEFEFTGGTKAVTLIASVPVDFANAEIEEWVSFTWSEVTRNTYSLAVTAQANQGTTQLTGDITINSLDGRYTVIIQCNEHGNEAYVRINGQTSITSSITCDTSALTFTATTRGGWRFVSDGVNPCTCDITGVTTEGSDERVITVTFGTNTSSSATKTYGFTLVSNQDSTIHASAYITQQVKLYLDMDYYNQVYPNKLPYNGFAGDSFSLTANSEVNLITAASNVLELPINPVPNPNGTRSVSFNALGLTPAYSASSANVYTFTISGFSSNDINVWDSIDVNYEPYPYINVLTQVEMPSGTTSVTAYNNLSETVVSNYGITIQGTSSSACTATISNGLLMITVNEPSSYEDKTYYVVFQTDGTIGPQITANLTVIRRGHYTKDYIRILPSSYDNMPAGSEHDFMAWLYDGLGQVIDGSITSSCTWTSSDDNTLTHTGWDSHGFALFSASTNISANTQVTLTAVFSGRSGEYNPALSATSIVTVTPVNTYRNLRFNDGVNVITTGNLSSPLSPVYVKADVYRGNTFIQTMDMTNTIVYHFYDSANTEITACTLGVTPLYIGSMKVENSGNYITFSKSGSVSTNEVYTVKVFYEVTDSSSPAVLTITVPADNYTYGNLKFIEGENIDDPALTQPINLGAEVESEFTYNVVRNIYRNNEFIDNENFTRDAQYTIYSGATTAGTGTGLTIPSQATTYPMFNDNNEFRLYFSNGEENWGYGLEFLTNNGVYPKTYTLVARDNASTVNPTSASVLINVAAREYIDSDLRFYNSAGTVINSFTVPSGTTQTGITTRYTHLTSGGSSLINTTPQATFKVYSGTTTTAGNYITSAVTNLISRGIYADNGFSIVFSDMISPPSLVLVSETALTEQKVFTLVVEKNELSGSCVFTFEPAPTPTPTNLRFFQSSMQIYDLSLQSAETKYNVNTVESIAGSDVTVTNEGRMSYTLYTGATPITTFDCTTPGIKYTGNGLSISYSTANGLTFTSNNNNENTRTFYLEANDTGNGISSRITIYVYPAPVSYSLFFARTASSGTPISTVSLSANQTADVYLVVRKTVGSIHEDTIVTAGGEESDFYSLNAPIASGFSNWEWYDDLYYPDGHEYVETPENGGLLLYGTDEDLVEPIIRICYNQQGRGGQYTLTGGYGNLTTNLTINLQEYGIVTNLYAKILNSIEPQPEPMKFRVGVMVNNVFSAISDYVTVSATSSYYGQSGWMNSGITTVPVSAWVEELSSVTFEIYTHATILDDVVAPDFGWFFWNNTEALYRREITTNDRQEAGGFYLYYKTLDLSGYDPGELGIMGIQIMRRTS